MEDLIGGHYWVGIYLIKACFALNYQDLTSLYLYWVIQVHSYSSLVFVLGNSEDKALFSLTYDQEN
ncbi:MAG: hypothetical protein ACKPFE_15850 [Dolichospermum sp.]